MAGTEGQDAVPWLSPPHARLLSIGEEGGVSVTWPFLIGIKTESPFRLASFIRWKSRTPASRAAPSPYRPPFGQSGGTRKQGDSLLDSHSAFRCISEGKKQAQTAWLSLWELVCITKDYPTDKSFHTHTPMQCFLLSLYLRQALALTVAFFVPSLRLTY